MLILVVISFIYTTDIFGCILIPLLEQKARATYEKLIDLCKDDPDVIDPLRVLREREVVHFQRFGEALRGIQDKLAQKKFYTATKSCMNSSAGCMKSEVLGEMDNDCGCNR